MSILTKKIAVVVIMTLLTWALCLVGVQVQSVPIQVFVIGAGALALLTIGLLSSGYFTLVDTRLEFNRSIDWDDPVVDAWSKGFGYEDYTTVVELWNVRNDGTNMALTPTHYKAMCVELTDMMIAQMKSEDANQ